MNVRITNLLRGVTALEVCVLIVAGGGLFFLPEVMSEQWPWGLMPFNARFLGAVYLAALVSAAALVIYPYWSSSRVIVPMIAVFTTIVLLVSVAYLDRFTEPAYAIIFWFILYIALPINAIYHVWFYRKQARDHNINLSRGVKSWLHFQSLFLNGYGIALLIAPQFASEFWPWGLDDFHARMYSVAFITPGVGAYMLVRNPTRNGLYILGASEIVLGLLPILGMALVDQSVDRIDWTQANTWLWIALFSYIALSGIIMVLVPLLQTREDAATEPATRQSNIA